MPSKLMQGDENIIRHVVDWGLLTPTEIQHLENGRHIVAVRRRLQALSSEPRKVQGKTLEGLGYLRFVGPPEDRFGENIWYPSQAAYDHALRHGWISQPITAVERKRSNNKLVHDRLGVAYRFALHQKYGDKLRASTAYYNLYDRWGQSENDHIFADLFFYLNFEPKYPSFFLELENTDEHSYQRGISARVRKAQAFAEYFNRGLFQEKFGYPDFRVIFIIPHPRQAENFAAKLHNMGGDLDSPRFWITDLDSALSGEDKIYMTPRDYQTRRYSLDEA